MQEPGYRGKIRYKRSLPYSHLGGLRSAVLDPLQGLRDLVVGSIQLADELRGTPSLQRSAARLLPTAVTENWLKKLHESI